jgi:hypothetical protein
MDTGSDPQGSKLRAQWVSQMLSQLATPASSSQNSCRFIKRVVVRMSTNGGPADYLTEVYIRRVEGMTTLARLLQVVPVQ